MELSKSGKNALQTSLESTQPHQSGTVEVFPNQTKSELRMHLASQMNPVLHRNMEMVNYTMEADMFENGPNEKSSPSVPIESFLRLSRI